MVSGPEPAATLARRLLANTWVVEDLDQLPPGFLGVAVTREGRAWFGFTRELRQAPRGGAERVLAQRNRRDGLIAEAARSGLAERAARDRADRADRIERLQDALVRDRALLPAAHGLTEVLAGVLEAVRMRVEALDADLVADREAGEGVAAALRACASEEAEIQ